MGGSYTGFDYTFAPVDLDLRSLWAWTWTDAAVHSAKLQSGTRLVVEGDLTAEGVTFTEADTGQGWGGVAVYSGGTLDFDAVTITDAEVGIEVHSVGNHFNDVLLDGNGVGLLAGPHCAYGGLCSLDRSAFSMANSCVTNSVWNPQQGLDYGYGIWALTVNAAISGTTVEDNDGHGLRLGDADVAAYDVLLTGNGGANDEDGVRVGSGGDLTLSSYFSGGVDERLSFFPGTNAVADNERHQIAIETGGFATVGLQCGILDPCPGMNQVSGTFGSGFSDPKLIWNFPIDVTIPAWGAFWDTNPSDPPNAAFLRPALVEDDQPGSTPPGTGIGHTDGCATAGAATSGGGIGGFRASLPTTHAAGGTAALRVDSDPELRLDPETAAWLRGRLAAMRAALAESPAADSASALLARLYGLQRLDRYDELGEHQATMALLASLHGRLQEGEALPPALRRTAEAALTYAVHDALRSSDLEAARTLLDRFGGRVEDEGVQRTLALAAVSMDAREGDFASALSGLHAVLEGLGPEEAPLAAGLEARAALYERWLAEGGQEPPARGAHHAANDAIAQVGAEARAEAIASTVHAAYPNPFNPSALIPFEVGAASHVEIAVFDLLGRRVALLADRRYEAGRYEVRFDGMALPSGVYLVRSRIEAASGVSAVLDTQRLLLLK